MDDDRLGTTLRAIRVREGLRQADLAARAKVSASMVGRIERGGASTIPLGRLRRIFRAMGARLDSYVRYEGAEISRLLDARHAAMQEAVTGLFASLDGWITEPEVSFSVYSERGVVDVLAWHPTRRMLLIIELKTEIVEVGRLMASMDQRRRHGLSMAKARGWDPVAVSTLVLIAESRTNRRAVARHRHVLRAKFPVDGRALRRWLHDPSERIDALAFLPYPQDATLRRSMAPAKRVVPSRRRPRPAA